MSFITRHITCTNDIQTKIDRLTALIDKAYDAIENYLTKGGLIKLKYDDGQTETEQDFESVEVLQSLINWLQNELSRLKRQCKGNVTKIIPSQNI